MKYRCESCDVIELCRKTFGKYWNWKSGGGVGCNHKLKSLKFEKVEKRPAVVASPGKTKQGGLL